jgi:putative tryptophan/tyrosine transport system substrate-binding protein
MSHMMRRAFITLLGGAVICPFAARAEKNDGVRRVGVIMGFAENDEVWQAYLASFRQGLQESRLDRRAQHSLRLPVPRR